jgi:cytochrome c556
MSKSEIWNVLADEDYREFNREFRASVRKLREAAEKDNFDNATLQWIDGVKSCVECHKYVRSQRPVLKK